MNLEAGLRPDQRAPTLRVCVGCMAEWHSVAFYSEEPSSCERCGAMLLETLSTTLDRARTLRSGPTRIEST